MNSAVASDWRQIAEGSDPKSVIYLDFQSIASAGSSKQKVWLKQVFESEQYFSPYHVSNCPYIEIKILTYFNCAERTIAEVQFIHYTKDGGVARSLALLPSEYMFSDIAPDSVGEIALSAVCTKAQHPRPAPSKPRAPTPPSTD